MNTSPSYTSVEYDNHYEQVELVSNLYSGVDSVTQYLTRFPRESAEVFLDRQNKATLKNFVKRISTSTRNIMLNKPPLVEVNSKLTPLMEKVNRQNSIETFIQEVALYQIVDGFTYIVIDAPVIDESIKTRKDEMQLDINPYMYIVRRNQVVNWKLNSDGSFKRLTIKELYEKDSGRYDDEYGVQYRTYFDDGTVEVWRDNAMVQSIPLGLKMVPVVRVDEASIPLLYDTARLNINHFNRRSNLDRYLSIAALPVPVIYGNTADAGITIGVDDALSFGDKNECGFEWVELSGSSVKALQEDLMTIEEAILAETISITSDQQLAKNETQVDSENLEGYGRLNQLATQLEMGINKALSILGKFKGIEDAGSITLNKEFKSSRLTSEQVKDIIALHANGLISTETALKNLIEGQVVEVEDLDVEKSLINDIS